MTKPRIVQTRHAGLRSSAMAPYKEQFPVGAIVTIDKEPRLRQFQESWQYHHKLDPEQMQYAGQSSAVARVMFYHGGDVLYELVDVPGIWHEQCLSSGGNP